MERQARQVASSRYSRTLTLLGLAAGLFLAAATIPSECIAAMDAPSPASSTSHGAPTRC